VRHRRFSIGIDLGTTNSVLAFAPLGGGSQPEVLLVTQWDPLNRLTEARTLPSFLYLPEKSVAAQLGGGWVVGQLARQRSSEVPGRVVHSAKSWLCHHSADRSAPILPWGLDDVAPGEKISPVRASALILEHLRDAWDRRFGGDGFVFNDQEIMITVPASFDAAAQGLTLAAAEQAGFPSGVRLLEEPQAAFYAWLDRHDAGDAGGGRPFQLLVVDIGGGTSDFSLFEVTAGLSEIKRIAVSDHILLGGDNIDLALAHFAEQKLGGERGQLAATQWRHLIATCRELKERVLSRPGPGDERFGVAVPGRGSGLMAASASTTLTRAEIEHVVLDGFFPVCDALARPYRTQGALREWGLPYASDSAVTRHLAEFLWERPRVDAVLFNGGSLGPPGLRERLREQIGMWQRRCEDGPVRPGHDDRGRGAGPMVLENAAPEFAVALGAARFGALAHQGAGLIAAGSGHAVFLEVSRADRQPVLLCVLPRGAESGQEFEITEPALEARTNQMVRFQAYSSTRHDKYRAGDIAAQDSSELRALPPLQTMLETQLGRDRVDGRVKPGHDGISWGPVRRIPVHLKASMNALGLLQIACVSAEPSIRQNWPLEFNLRPHEQGDGEVGAEVAGETGPNAPAEAIEAAHKTVGSVFAGPSGKGSKANPATVFKSLERALGLPRAEWNAPLLRTLWRGLEHRFQDRKLSVDHEEIWIVLAGFLLRPGFGVAGDAYRMDSLWRLQESGLCFPGKRIGTQTWLLWRRVAGGLTASRQEQLLSGEMERLRKGEAAAELVRLAGSLELLPRGMKTELADVLVGEASALARVNKHRCAPYFSALGLLLNRAPLYGGPENVLPPEFVERAYEAFSGLDWADPAFLELQTLFLRAARVVGDRSLEVARPVRNRIAAKLEKAGVASARTGRIKEFVAVSRADRVSLYGEALPAGLVLGADGAG
jgi:molecular chaperone DnaK (HSP70)